MDSISNIDLISTILDVYRQPFCYGFVVTTILEILSYGIFKAVSLLNIKK